MRLYLRALRGGDTKQKVAKKMNVHISDYSRLEKAERDKDMRLSTMESIARTFDLTVEEVLKLELEFKEMEKRKSDKTGN